MASIPAGTLVRFRAEEMARLRFPPPCAEAGIAVHPDALRAPQNGLTLAACADAAGRLQWVGAVDEQMLLPTGERRVSLRAAILDRLLVGGRSWQVVRPGLLITAGRRRSLPDALRRGAALGRARRTRGRPAAGRSFERCSR